MQTTYTENYIQDMYQKKELQRLKTYIIDGIKIICQNNDLFNRIISATKTNRLTVLWRYEPKLKGALPIFVDCTFYFKDKPLFSVAVTPELKKNLLDFFTPFFHQRINLYDKTSFERSTTFLQHNLSNYL